MALAAHTLRRNAIYYWRRRMPTALGGKVLLISLQTPDPRVAKRLSALVTAESALAFGDMVSGCASHAQTLDRLRTVIRDELGADMPVYAPPQRREGGRPAPTTYSPSIKAVAARLMEQKRKSGMSEAMIRQMTTVFDLFREITDIQDMRLLRQSHLAQFVDTLGQLPQTYRKSPKDKAKSIHDIIKDGNGQGLSPTTINRNLDYLGQLFTKARSEGIQSVATLDLSTLRPRKTVRDRDQRAAFTQADVQRIFAHPVWHGFQSKKQWQESGDRLLYDGLYWVPIIAALTGARREEIAGLKAVDIVMADHLPALMIRPNANRGLKNLTSERTLPLHPQLIALGLPEYAARQVSMRGQQADLFPDLRPRNAGKGFGEQIDYRFRLLVQRQLDGNPAAKVFHSFRHYVAIALGRIPDVTEATRKDILGHAGGSITAERYSEATPLGIMSEALSKLPWLPVKVTP